MVAAVIGKLMLADRNGNVIESWPVEFINVPGSLGDDDTVLAWKDKDSGIYACDIEAVTIERAICRALRNSELGI